MLFACAAYGQEDRFYHENGGELIFSFAELVKSGNQIKTPPRFSMFFHLTHLYHYDLNSFSGLYSGYALRNIGFITEEGDTKTKRRTYSLGVPLALKIGKMKDDFYLFGGGSYELFFHYKQKQFVDGKKSKYSEWFGSRTKLFAPSLFAGIHFPGGITLKFKYYPENFLNKDFRGTDFGEEVSYSDFSKSNLFYIGLSYQIRPDKILKEIRQDKNKEQLAYRRK